MENDLMAAAIMGDLARVQNLVRGGRSVTETYGGRTALLFAAGNGRVEVVKWLIIGAGVDRDTLLAARTEERGLSALLLASLHGHMSTVQCLLGSGASLQERSTDGRTALLCAASHFPLLKWLLEVGGASISETTNDGRTIWDLLRHKFRFDLRGHSAVNALLRVLVLHGDPPRQFVGDLSRYPQVIEEGARLRARIPAYLAHRRAFLDAKCPLLAPLPEELWTLIFDWEGPATTDELWATGLGRAP
jgi:hypothetical protein